MRSYIWWLAWKQVFFPHKKAGLFFMTLISMLGVAIGIAALVITLSVMGGFERKLRSTIFGGLPHLEVSSKPERLGWSMQSYPLAFFREKLPEVKQMSAFIKADVIIKHGDRLASGTFMGVDPRNVEDIWGFHQDPLVRPSLEELLFHGEGSLPPVLLGADLAAQLQVLPGEEVRVLAPGGVLSGFLSGKRLFEAYRVVGTFRSMRSEYDEGYLVADLSKVRRYMADYDSSLEEEEYITGVAVTFHDPDQVDELTGNALGDEFSVRSWKDVNHSLLMALLLEKLAMGAVLFLIVVVAAFSLSGTVMMTVHYQRTQISLLRGLGMTWRDVVKMFVAQGIMMGLAGLMVGMVLGIGFCVLLQDIGSMVLLKDLLPYYRIPVRFLWFDYTIIGTMALLLTVLASLYPAFLAGKQDPGAALRY